MEEESKDMGRIEVETAVVAAQGVLTERLCYVYFMSDLFTHLYPLCLQCSLALRLSE